MFNSILELIYIRPPQFLKCIVNCSATVKPPLIDSLLKGLHQLMANEFHSLTEKL
jgi:hypothetical protein